MSTPEPDHPPSGLGRDSIFANPPPAPVVHLEIRWPDDTNSPILVCTDREAQPSWPDPIPLDQLLAVFSPGSSTRPLIKKRHEQAIARQHQLEQHHQDLAADARYRASALRKQLGDR